MSEIEAATDEELLDELARRHKAVLAVMIKADPHGDDADAVYMRYDGGLTTAIGMATRARAVLLKDATRENKREE